MTRPQYKEGEKLSVTKISSMEIITDSPYEQNTNAEVGERLFDYTKSLMDPDDVGVGLGLGLGLVVGDGFSNSPNKLKRTTANEPSTEAIEVFGKEQAYILLQTNHNISASGMLYSSTWTQGYIRGTNCGVVEKELLLLCLRDHRLARGSAGDLKCIIKDLKVYTIFVDTLSEWKLKTMYPRLAKCQSVTKFRHNQLKCLKCIIFIVRAVISMKVLQWNFLALSDDDGTTLKSKIFSCLDILEKNADIDDLINNNKKKKSTTTTTPRISHHKSLKTTTVAARKVSIISTKKKKATVVAKTNGTTTTTTTTKKNNNNKNNDNRIRRVSDINHDSEQIVPKKCPPPLQNPSLKRQMISEMIVGAVPSYSSVTSNNKILPSTDIKIQSNTSCTSNGFVHDLFLCVNKKGEKEISSSLHHHMKPEILSDDVHDLPKKKAKFSHDLFNFKDTTTINGNNKNNNKVSTTNVIKMPKNLASTASNAGPGYVSNDNCSNNSAGDPNFWYPIDLQELILSPIEIEAAWLVEESIYCNRKENIDWVFVWNYASPILKVKLRKIKEVVGGSGSGISSRSSGGATKDAESSYADEMIAKLLHNGLAAKRFVIVRRDIRRKLLNNELRPRMVSIVPKRRKATHPLRLKKLAAAAAAAARAGQKTTYLV